MKRFLSTAADAPEYKCNLFVMSYSIVQCSRASQHSINKYKYVLKNSQTANALCIQNKSRKSKVDSSVSECFKVNNNCNQL